MHTCRTYFNNFIIKTYECPETNIFYYINNNKKKKH